MKCLRCREWHDGSICHKCGFCVQEFPPILRVGQRIRLIRSEHWLAISAAKPSAPYEYCRSEVPAGATGTIYLHDDGKWQALAIDFDNYPARGACLVGTHWNAYAEAFQCVPTNGFHRDGCAGGARREQR
jgi:hypothetical protein